ncbi:MAG TPA: DegT/DnrJ/EryC1/StrS family aminotransferase, partial [Tepidisphaeraceae bacterium]
EMAKRAGRLYGIAVSNGTAALDLALRVLGIGRGDEVLLPAFSYVATASMVVMQGARPVFADVDPRNLCLDPVQTARRLSLRTRGVLCTDYGGNPCDYAKLSAICQRHGIPLIVDGAQSIGTLFDGRPALSYGTISTTSFHAAKTMTTIEGGMIFTDDAAIARRLRMLRSQGEDPGRKYYHIEIGHNFRMTEMQAAIGLMQLEKLDRLLAARQVLASRYHAHLAALGLPVPPGIPKSHNSYFLYALLVPQRDEIAARLKLQGIETRSCYPLPLYRQPVFEHLKHEICQVAEQACQSILNPPMFFGMTSEQQRRVARELAAAIEAIAPEHGELRKAV